MGNLVDEFRKQFVLADDKGDVIRNIDLDEQRAAGHRHHMGDQIMRAMSAERTSSSVTESAARSDRRREHQATIAAHATESADQRRAIEGAVLNSEQSFDESDFSL